MTFSSLFIKGLPGRERFPMVVSHFSYRREQFPFTRSGEAALLEFNRTCPEWGRRFLKSLKGFGPELKSVIFPRVLSLPQNRELARRTATEPAFLKQFFNEGVLDLRRAPLAQKAGYVDLTADFPEKQRCDKLLKLFEPENMGVIEADQEVSNLALFHSLWQVRVMIYKAQYSLSARPLDESGSMYQEAKGLMIYAERFVTKLLNEFPFSQSMYRNSLEMIPAFFARGNPGTINSVLVSITDRLGADCDKQEAVRLRSERGRRALQTSCSLADSINDLARTKYMIAIGTDGIWKIPQATFRSAGAVLRREQVVSQVEESAVVRRTQHEIDSICEDKQKLETAIQALTAGFDGSALGRALSACEQGRVVSKVKARLLIGLAADLSEVAGWAASIPEMTPARQRLLKFSASMLSLAARQLVERNQVLHNQIVRLEVKKRILEALVEKRTERYEALKIAADSLTGKLTDERFMSGPENPAQLRKEAITAYRLVQSEKDLEAGIAESKVHLREVIRLAGRLSQSADARGATRQKDLLRTAVRLFKHFVNDRFLAGG